MTSTLLSIDAAVVFLVLAIWTWAGLRAGGLPYAATPRELRRGTGRVLLLAGIGVALVAVRVGIVAALAPAGWWFAQEKVVLAMPLLLGATAATLAASVPRVVSLRRAAGAFNGVNAMPPTLRHEAAHPLVAWPVQVTAYAAAAGVVVFFIVSYPATAGSSLAVVAGVAAAAVVTWRRHARRHLRLAGDVIIPARRARLLRSAAVAGTLGSPPHQAPQWTL